jgi:hypothetical protein
MPSKVDDSGVDLSFSSNDLSLIDSPRQCTKTKSHVEGGIVPDGQLYAGENVKFSTMKQVRCDLCRKRDNTDHHPKVRYP